MHALRSRLEGHSKQPSFPLEEQCEAFLGGYICPRQLLCLLAAVMLRASVVTSPLLALRTTTAAAVSMLVLFFACSSLLYLPVCRSSEIDNVPHLDRTRTTTAGRAADGLTGVLQEK